MKYKVGDKVMIKNSYNGSINNIGSIVKIDESKNAPYKIETDSRIIIWTIESLLELVGSPEYINALHKEPTLKVSKDIYDAIRDGADPDLNEKKGIIYKYIDSKYYNIDKLIEFCQALKAYPDIEPIEELYYIKIGQNTIKKPIFLVQDINEGYYYLGGGMDENEKSEFTMQEIKELGEKEGKDYTQFAVKVEE